jgi:hypothetical protein
VSITVLRPTSEHLKLTLPRLFCCGSETLGFTLSSLKQDSRFLPPRHNTLSARCTIRQWNEWNECRPYRQFQKKVSRCGPALQLSGARFRALERLVSVRLERITNGLAKFAGVPCYAAMPFYSIFSSIFSGNSDGVQSPNQSGT